MPDPLAACLAILAAAVAIPAAAQECGPRDYRVTYIRAYDGDTPTVDIHLGYGFVWQDQALRLLRIDTPEIRGGGEAAIEARDWLRDRLSSADRLVIGTDGDELGKYGRPLVELCADGANVGDEMLRLGLAAPYE